MKRGRGERGSPLDPRERQSVRCPRGDAVRRDREPDPRLDARARADSPRARAARPARAILVVRDRRPVAGKRPPSRLVALTFDDGPDPRWTGSSNGGEVKPKLLGLGELGAVGTSSEASVGDTPDRAEMPVREPRRSRIAAGAAAIDWGGGDRLTGAGEAGG